jgi:hypothetical protein
VARVTVEKSSHMMLTSRERTVDMTKITAYQSCVMSLLAMFVLLLTATPTSAVPITGFLEGTAENGWQGAYAVQLMTGQQSADSNRWSGGLRAFPRSHSSRQDASLDRAVALSRM